MGYPVIFSRSGKSSADKATIYHLIFFPYVEMGCLYKNRPSQRGGRYIAETYREQIKFIVPVDGACACQAVVIPPLPNENNAAGLSAFISMPKSS